DKGIPFADVFGYTSYPFPELSVDTVTALVLKQSRTRRILAEQARAALFTPRDFLTAHIAAKAGVSAAVLPCSSFWSPAFFGIKPATRVYNAISVFPITKDKWFADALMGIAGELSKELPTWLICHTAPEYKWLTSFYPDAANIRCIFDPFSLLDFYSKVDKIVACRLHAAIPAFALGCRLSYISFDSRSFALDQFHVGHILYTDIAGGQPPDYFYSLSKASLPDPAPFIALFKTEVVSKL
ncbi:MAG TPA: polysaccharide pyruvyl transferase family protein, partial [Desulfatiglandales bacterium]|nr:polysaccharide pyruvyl transferase family protein [Desulfatiglandales bacterium]